MNKVLLLMSLIICFSGYVYTETRNMTRTEDPVVVVGEQLALFTGTSIETLGVMVLRKGKWEPIPFQIDERKADGTFAYKSGDEASVDEEANWDGNDELVFMAGDMGDKWAGKSPPERGGKGIEIMATDPLSGERAWAYVFQFNGSPPLSAIDYVQVEIFTKENKKYITGRDSRGSGYTMGAPLNELCPDELYFLKAGGKRSPDMLDRLKLRGPLISKILIRFELKLDTVIRTQLLAYTDGPVRTVYKGKGTFKLGIINIPGKGEEYVTAYRRIFQETIAMTMPFKFKNLLKEFLVLGRMDFTEAAIGYKVYNGVNPPDSGLIIDGKMSEAELKADYTNQSNWIAGYGSEGGLVFRLVFDESDPEWKKTTQHLYYSDDLTLNEKPEDNPGALSAGIDVRGIGNLDTGSGVYTVFFFIDPAFKVGDEKGYLNIFDTPLKVETEVLKN